MLELKSMALEYEGEKWNGILQWMQTNERSYTQPGRRPPRIHATVENKPSVFEIKYRTWKVELNR